MVDEHNPYAPPGAVGGERGDPAADGAADYASERRPVFVVIGLTLLTLGVYPSIWFLRRRPFLDGRKTRQPLGSTLPIVAIVMNVLGFASVFGGKEAASISSFLSLAGGVALLLASFRTAAILRSDFARTGRFLGVSSLATFFLSVYYLQYKINQAADTPALAKRKKKRKRSAETPAVASDEAAAEESA